jgi:hypothetical protein
MKMNLNLDGLVTTLKQIFLLVSVFGGAIVCLKAFGIAVPVTGSLTDWGIVTGAMALASK